MDTNDNTTESEVLQKKSEDIVAHSDLSQEDKVFLQDVLTNSGELFLVVFLGLFEEDSANLAVFVTDLRAKIALLA